MWSSIVCLGLKKPEKVSVLRIKGANWGRGENKGCVPTLVIRAELWIWKSREPFRSRQTQI